MTELRVRTVHTAPARRRAVVMGAVAATAVAPWLAACSSGSPGPPDYGTPTPIATSSLARLDGTDLLARARTAVLAAGGAEVAGQSAATASTPPAAGPSAPGEGGGVSFDLKLRAVGDGAGSMTVSGDTLQLVRAGGHTYIQAAPSFWDAVASGAGAKVGGRWVSVSSGDDQLTQFGAFLDLSGLLSQLTSSETGGAPQVVGPQLFQGRPVLAVRIPEADGDATAYVAADGGPPYLLGMVESLDGEPVQVTLNAIGPQPAPAAPAPASVVDDSAVPGL